MKRQGNNKIQKFSLRKYKGVGAASVLLGMLYLGASPVLAEENPMVTAKEEVSNATDKIEMVTLSNDVGSYRMPRLHVFQGLSDFVNYEFEESGYKKTQKSNEEWAEYDFKRVERETIRKQDSDSFKDTKVSYITKEDKKIKSDSDVENSVENEKIPSTSMDYKIRGLFGKRYEGKMHTLTNADLEKIRDADKTLETNEGTYHKIGTLVEKKYGTKTETTFNDITIHGNPTNLHNEDGSIRYENIKDGARVWLVSETSESHYDKYVLAIKPTDANDTWARNTFKNGEGQAKEFTKNNVDSDGGFKEGDTILVIEKNEVALSDGHSTVTEQPGPLFVYSAGTYYHEEGLAKGLAELFEKRSENLIEGNDKPKKWEEIYKFELTDKGNLDNKKRPLNYYAKFMDGFIRENNGIKEYRDIEIFISKLKEKFGDTEIRTGWNPTRDIVEPKFKGNIDEYKDTVNYQREKEYVTKFTEAHKNIQYVDKAPIDANFVKNVFEVDVEFKYGDRDRDYNYPREELANSENTEKKYLAYSAALGESSYDKYQYGLGQLYKEFMKEDIVYRVASTTKDDVKAVIPYPTYNEIHYYDLYQPTRAYHISDKLTNIKNIYAKEEKAVTENKGSVIVKYELADGTSLKESVDVVKDAVVSSTETKYYLDKDNQKVIVGTPTTINKEVLYDTTTSELKLQEITKDGKKYKLVGLKAGSPAETGKVVSGTTEITYVYKLSTAGNVFEKYMIEGNTTEIAMEKQLTKEVSIGDAYTSTHPKVYTVIQKDGKSYIYKGHRSTSAPETGTVDETAKTVIYDFVEFIAEKGDPAKQDNLPEGIVSEKGEPEKQEELPEGVVSEKGKSEVQEELPEGVVSEKGEPEVQNELPEAVITEKGVSTIHEIDKLIVTRHISKDEGVEIIPSEKGKFPPEQDFVDNNGRYYKYIETKEHDGIITHLYKQVIRNSKEITYQIKQDEKKILTNREKLNKLPNTGDNSSQQLGLGIVALICAGVIRKKKTQTKE